MLERQHYNNMIGFTITAFKNIFHVHYLRFFPGYFSVPFLTLLFHPIITYYAITRGMLN